MRFPRPPARPHNLPPEILWTWDNCKNNTFVGMTASNMSCPPMRCAICHENGDVITDAEWKAICQSATLVAHTHLFPLSHVSQTGAKQTRKKMYFKRYFSLEWAAALQELESLAPLLSLCFGEYKADHTLGSVLHDETSPCATPPPSPMHRHLQALAHLTPLLASVLLGVLLLMAPLLPLLIFLLPPILLDVPLLVAALLPLLLTSPPPLPLRPPSAVIPLPLVVLLSSPLKGTPNHLQLWRRVSADVNRARSKSRRG